MCSSISRFGEFRADRGTPLNGFSVRSQSGSLGSYEHCDGPCWRPGAMREAALGLTRGDATLLAQALDEASNDPGRQVCLCEHVIEAHAALWAEDLCTECHISLGLALALSTFRRHQADVDAPAHGKPLLIAPVPGESHFIGASLAYTMLTQAGRAVSYEFPRSNGELAALLDAQPFSGLVLISSGVFPRQHRTGQILETVETARRHGPAPFRILLYGKLAGCEKAAARQVGADGACASALQLDGLLLDSATPKRRQLH
jgi:hypothetical protein